MEEERLTGISLEDMDADHLPEVLEIERASCSMPWSESLFFNEIKNPRSIPKVARIDGKVVGYLCSSVILDEGHILNLAVHPEFRMLGIASALVDNIVDELKKRECRFIFLEVRISNEYAKYVYEKFGFRIIGVRKNYYDSPVEDAIVMALRLKE